MSAAENTMLNLSARRQRTWGKVLLHLLLLIGVVIVMIPFAWTLSTSLKPEGQVYTFPPKWIPEPILWGNYVDALTALPFGLYTRNTLYLAIGRIVGLLFTCSIVAYSFARLRWKGRDTLFFIVLATLMIPFEVTLVPQYVLFSEIGWVNTFLPLIVPAFFAGNPFFIFLMRQFFMSISSELDDAARIDGCGYFDIYWRIILPLSKPVLAVVAIFAFQNNWNSFLLPLIYLHDRDLYTLALGLNLFQEENYTRWTLLMAASLTIMLPVILLFFLLQRYFIQGVVFTGVKG